MAGIQSLDAFLAKIIKRGIADTNKDGKLSEQEEALFTYMPEAKGLSDTLNISDENSQYVPIDWANVNNKLKDLQEFGDLTLANSAAKLMQSLDTDNDGTIEDEEISEQLTEQNILNMNILFKDDDQSAASASALFDFSNMLNYAELVDIDSNGEISEDEAKAFGELVSSKNDVKLADSATTVDKADFLTTLKKHIKGSALSDSEKAVIANVKGGKYSTVLREAVTASIARAAEILGIEAKDIDESTATFDDSGRISKFTVDGKEYIVTYVADDILFAYKDENYKIDNATADRVDKYNDNNQLIETNLKLNDFELTDAITYGENNSVSHSIKIGETTIDNVESYTFVKEGDVILLKVKFKESEDEKLYTSNGTEYTSAAEAAE